MSYLYLAIFELTLEVTLYLIQNSHASLYIQVKYEIVYTSLKYEWRRAHGKT